MHLIEIKNRMSQLRDEIKSSNNPELFKELGDIKLLTNLQLIRAIMRLKIEYYLKEQVSDIVMCLVLKYDGNISEETINKL